jgi:hypothetical protein
VISGSLLTHCERSVQPYTDLLPVVGAGKLLPASRVPINALDYNILIIRQMSDPVQYSPRLKVVAVQDLAASVIP